MWKISAVILLFSFTICVTQNITQSDNIVVNSDRNNLSQNDNSIWLLENKIKYSDLNVSDKDVNSGTKYDLSIEETEAIKTHGQLFISIIADVLDNCANKFDKTAFIIQVILSKDIENSTKSFSDFKSENTVITEVAKAFKELNILPKEFLSDLDVKGADEILFKTNETHKHTDRSWNYFTKLYNTVENACDALPIQVQQIYKKLQSSQQITSEQAIIKSLVIWGRDWIQILNKQVKEFLLICFSEPSCDDAVALIIKLSGKILNQEDLSGKSEEIVFDDGLNKIERSLNTFVESSIEYLLLSKPGKEPFDDAINNDDDYWLTSSVIDKDKVNDHSILHTLETNPFLAWIIRLIRYPFQKGQNPINTDVRVKINTTTIKHVVPDTFLSFGLESQVMSHNFDTRSVRLQTLVKGLAPAILRVGGTSCNFLTYNPTTSSVLKFKRHAVYDRTHSQEDVLPIKGVIPENHPKYHAIYNDQISNVDVLSNGRTYIRVPRSTNIDNKLNKAVNVRFKEGSSYYSFLSKKHHTNYTMDQETWDNLLNFTQDLNLTLLFDLNQFYRDSSWNWDPVNALELFRSTKKSYPQAKIMWQLGNEPNAYKHLFNFEITPERSADDFYILRKTLDQVFPTSHIVGPDVTRPKHIFGNSDTAKKLMKGNGGFIKIIDNENKLDKDSMEYLTEYLKAISNKDVNIHAVSWHQYYLNGRIAQVDNFTSTAVMDELIKQIREVKNISDTYASGKEIWLTETGSAYGGGAPDLSDRFVAGFLWLAKLGDAAAEGVSVVTRQTLYGGHYSLIDDQMFPLPDYWLSLLYKNIVGRKVLDVSLSGATSSVRLYSHCVKSSSQYYKPGGITIFGVNTNETEVLVQLPENLKDLPILKFQLQPFDGDLKSGEVLLNGRVLTMVSDEQLPTLHPQSEDSGGLHFPATSLVFWVVPDAAATVCM